MSTETVRAYNIPDGVPDRLYISDVAKVLRLTQHHIDYLTRRGKIPLLNASWRDRSEWREYSPQDIAEYAQSRRITPNWSALE